MAKRNPQIKFQAYCENGEQFILSSWNGGGRISVMTKDWQSLCNFSIKENLLALLVFKIDSLLKKESQGQSTLLAKHWDRKQSKSVKDFAITVNKSGNICQIMMSFLGKDGNKHSVKLKPNNQILNDGDEIENMSTAISLSYFIKHLLPASMFLSASQAETTPSNNSYTSNNTPSSNTDDVPF